MSLRRSQEQVLVLITKISYDYTVVLLVSITITPVWFELLLSILLMITIPRSSYHTVVLQLSYSTVS